MSKVSEKYSSAKEDNKDKLVMSNGAYAVCEMLEELITAINRQRMK